jgi:hypothetical protein
VRISAFRILAFQLFSVFPIGASFPQMPQMTQIFHLRNPPNLWVIPSAVGGLEALTFCFSAFSRFGAHDRGRLEKGWC